MEMGFEGCPLTTGEKGKLLTPVLSVRATAEVDLTKI